MFNRSWQCFAHRRKPENKTSFNFSHTGRISAGNNEVSRLEAEVLTLIGVWTGKKDRLIYVLQWTAQILLYGFSSLY